MKETRSEIVHIADELIRTKGYNAFSYKDIAERLKIKNASIHYYFPSKSDLGVEVIKHTATAFREETTSWSGWNARKQFEKFVTMHNHTQQTHWVCLMGALSPSVDTLSDAMQLELKGMANSIVDFLTNLLAQGREEQIFAFEGDAKTKAFMIQSALLASLLLDKVMSNGAYITIQNGVLKSV